MSKPSYIHGGDRFVMLRTLEGSEEELPVLMEVFASEHPIDGHNWSCGTSLYRVDPEVWPNQAKFSAHVNFLSDRQIREYINNNSPEIFLQARVRDLMEDLDDTKTQLVEGSRWANNAWGYLRETAGVHDGRIDVDEPLWAKHALDSE